MKLYIRSIVLAFAATAFMTAFNLAAVAQTSTELTARAEQAFNAGKYDDVITDTTAAIKLDPKNAVAYRIRSQVHIMRLQDEPRKPEWKYIPTPIAERSANAVNAVTDINMAISLDPSNAFPFHIRGSLYYVLNDLEAAIADLERVVAVNKTYKPSVDLLAMTKKRLAAQFATRGTAARDAASKLPAGDERTKKLEEAVEYYSKTISRDPTDPNWYWSRSRAYEDLERYDLAIADLTTGIGLNPSDTVFYYLRGGMYVKQKEYDKALADYGTPIPSLEKQKNTTHITDLRVERGKIYMLKGDAERALAELNMAVTLSPRSHLAYYERGRAHAMNNDPAMAEADLRKALEIVPGHTGSVDLLRKMGKTP